MVDTSVEEDSKQHAKYDFGTVTNICDNRALLLFNRICWYNNHFSWVGVISAKKHKRQRRERQSVTAKREKSQTPKVVAAILTLPNLTWLDLT